MWRYMDQGLIGVIIAAITAISGYFALRSKANTAQVARLDKAQSNAIRQLTEYADRLEKQIAAMIDREMELIKRLESLERQVLECHQRNSELVIENIVLHSKLDAAMGDK